MRHAIWRAACVLLLLLVAAGVSGQDPGKQDKAKELTSAPKGFDVKRDAIPQGKMETIEYESKVSSGKRKMVIYTPPGYSTSTGQMPVYIDVVIPPRAEITFENERTTQTGSRRLFISPPIRAGQNYTYHIKAKWTENGREVTRSRTVPVHAGERVMVDLTSTSTEDRREE